MRIVASDGPDCEPRRKGDAMDGQERIDSLRLRAEQKREILNSLDRCAAAGSPEAQKRDQTRFAYRVDDVSIKIFVTELDVRHFVVCARNISRGGLAFLHGSFLYEGTRCEACLIRLSGNALLVTGKVVRCRHVTGRVHEVGMAFSEKIELEDLCKPAVDEVRRALGDGVSGEVPAIRGQVLCIHNTKEEGRGIESRLKYAGAAVSAVTSLGAGIDCLKRGRYGVVICDSGLEEARPWEAIRGIRKAGFCGGLLTLREQGSVYTAEQLLKAGATRVLSAPVRTPELLSSVAALAA